MMDRMAIIAMIIGAAAAMLEVKRKWWVKPWLKERQKGNLNLINYEVHNGPRSYQNFLRMDETTFEILLNMVEADIRKQDTRLRDSISARDRLIITLRYLATGESYKSLSYSFRIGHCTISKIVPEVCARIYKNLKSTYLKVPHTAAEWLNISQDFLEKWNFPNTIGALDGKHILIKAPQAEGSAYYNYKGSHSIVLLALADANYKFIYVDIGTNGRVSDGGVYRRSKLANLIAQNLLNIAEDAPLPGRTKSVPFVMVADAAFPLCQHILKPFPFRNMTQVQRIYNYRLSRARRVVENVFGILTTRFRVLLNTVNLCPDKVETIALACITLHNYLRTRTCSEVSLDRRYTFKYGLSRQSGNRATHPALNNRLEFVEYVNGIGAVEWQNEFV